MTSTQPRLELRAISRIFNDRKVVNDLSLDLHAGQVTCLLGPSGCGKSTTLRIAAGVDRQDDGAVLMDGEVVCDETISLPPEQRGIGLMFQDFALFPHLNVAKNIAFGLGKGNHEQRVSALLAQMGLAGKATLYPHQLSGGEQQRVALARTLAPEPKVILMDEPFSGLDDRLRDAVRDETLDQLRKSGASVLLVTHEPAEAMRMADHIALMRNGRIVQQGAPYNIYNTPIDREAAAFFSDLNIIEGQAKGGLIETAFGQFLAPGIGDQPVEICIRPQHLKIDFDRGGRGPNPTESDGVSAKGSVMRARFMGEVSLVEFAMDFDDQVLQVKVPGVFLPQPDTVMWLSMRRDRCFVFPKSEKNRA